MRGLTQQRRRSIAAINDNYDLEKGRAYAEGLMMDEGFKKEPFYDFALAPFIEWCNNKLIKEAPMQETYFNDGSEQKRFQEFFSGESEKVVEKQMDARFKVLEAEGHTFKRRVKIGRNDMCPCGSSLKFKRCCIGKVRSD